MRVEKSVSKKKTDWMLTAYKDEKNSGMDVKPFARTKILIATMRL